MEEFNVIFYFQEGGTGSTMDRPLDIPKEIWRLVDHLFQYGLNQVWVFYL